MHRELGSLLYLGPPRALTNGKSETDLEFHRIELPY